MKLLFWTSVPNHYQSAIYNALRARGICVHVNYLTRFDKRRINLGWELPKDLCAGEQYVSDVEAEIENIHKLGEFVHFVPGAGGAVQRRLIRALCRSKLTWVNWSERGHPGWRWLVSLPIKWWFAHHINRYGRGTFAIGRAAIADFEAWGIRPEKIGFLPYAPPPLAAGAIAERRVEEFVNGRLAFIYLGTLSKRKGCDVLLKAFASLPEHPPSVLVLAGNDTASKAYSRLAERLGVADRVLFVGAVAPSSIASVAVKCQVLILPSRFDGWGVVLNEGASLGLALVASNRVGASDHLIECGVNGFRVQAGSTKSLAFAMQKYVFDSQLATLHGTHSKTIFARFTPSMAADRLISTMRSWGIKS